MKRKIRISGRINRPSYEGEVTFYPREGESEEEAIARTWRNTSLINQPMVDEKSY